MNFQEITEDILPFDVSKNDFLFFTGLCCTAFCTIFVIYFLEREVVEYKYVIDAKVVQDGPILLFTPGGDGFMTSLSVDNPILKDVKGYHNLDDLDDWFTDEMSLELNRYLTENYDISPDDTNLELIHDIPENAPKQRVFSLWAMTQKKNVVCGEEYRAIILLVNSQCCIDGNCTDECNKRYVDICEKVIKEKVNS